MFAVVELQWHQFIVKNGAKIIVDNIVDQSSENIICDKVLLCFDAEGSEVAVWAPYLDKKVTFKILNNQKADKIRVVKFHRKNRYERNIWFRAQQTVLEVISID